MSYWGIGVVNTDCPFYLRESEKTITCEGVEEETMAKKEFKDRSQKEAFQKTYCFAGCKRCANAEAILKRL